VANDRLLAPNTKEASESNTSSWNPRTVRDVH